jgi:hypothetical protein
MESDFAWLLGLVALIWLALVTLVIWLLSNRQ